MRPASDPLPLRRCFFVLQPPEPSPSLAGLSVGHTGRAGSSFWWEKGLWWWCVPCKSNQSVIASWGPSEGSPGIACPSPAAWASCCSKVGLAAGSTHCTVVALKHPDGFLFRTILVTEGRERVVWCGLQRFSSLDTVAGRRWKMAPAFGQHFKGSHQPIHAGP